MPKLKRSRKGRAAHLTPERVQEVLHERTVRYPMKTVSEINRHEGWKARHARAQRQRSGSKLMLRQATGWIRPVAGEGIRYNVHLVRVSPRPLDGDNLQSALKASRDGVADWIRLDDADPRVVWTYDQVRGRPKEYSVEITVQIWRYKS